MAPSFTERRGYAPSDSPATFGAPRLCRGAPDARYFCCFESLGFADVPDEPPDFILVSLEAFVSDEAGPPVLGEAAGLLLDGGADVFATPSLADVSASRRPVAFSPCFC